jgi:arginase
MRARKDEGDFFVNDAGSVWNAAKAKRRDSTARWCLARASGAATISVGAVSVLAVPFFIGEPLSGLEVPAPHEVLEPMLPDADPQHRMGVLYEHLAGWVAAEDRSVVFAGDCVSVIGVLAGVQRKGIDPTLLFFDAHGDFNTWETTPSEFIGGMPLAMATGRGEQTIVTGAGLTPLPDERVFLVGARDLDPGEAAALDTSAVTRMAVAEICDRLPPGPLHVHVDLDVVVPGEMPAMGYPAPGGPSLEAVCSAMADLAFTGRVVAVSFSTWNPELPGADVAAAAALRVAAPFLLDT